MIVTIHQPEHLPWLGLIDKIASSDTFVVLDNVQYRKNYFQNRNKVRVGNDLNWITIPVKKSSLKTQIKDIKVQHDVAWREKYLNAVTNAYAKAPYFDKYFTELKSVIEKDYELLADYNVELLKKLCAWYRVNTAFVLASELVCDSGTSSNILLDICKELKADTYLSGISGKDYLNEDIFKDNSISVIYQEFYHPIYEQGISEFIPCVSSIEPLFLYGDEATDILFDKSRDRMDTLFE